MVLTFRTGGSYGVTKRKSFARSTGPERELFNFKYQKCAGPTLGLAIWSQKRTTPERLHSGSVLVLLLRPRASIFFT